MPDELPFGSWPSSITANSVVAGVTGFSELCCQANELFWLESRPDEGGRSTLVCYSHELGKRELTPAPYNVRSRVHEYGGGAFTVAETGVFFVNFADQNIYQVKPGGEIQAVTSGGDDVRFADFQFDPARQRLISVVERHTPGEEPLNLLGAIDLLTGEITALEQQHDFYASPRLPENAEKLAFVAWDHPNMPWDGTVLKVAQFAEDGGLTNTLSVAGGVAESVTQPDWLTDNALVFLSDENGFWNLYRYDSSGIYCVLEDGADYAQPAWAFGLRDYTVIDRRHIAAVRRTAEGSELVFINTETGMATPLAADGPCCGFDYLASQGAQLYFVANFVDRMPAVEQFNVADQTWNHLAEAGGPQIDPDDIARARPLTYPTRDGHSAHAYFYPPTSAARTGNPAELAPLLVMSHGGPTSASSNALSLRVQYYTSRGWAVLDVNYRGSSGFGRRYREALNGNWGLIDVTDCEDGVAYLVREKAVDPERVAIRGGSAGGFTTLAALTTSTTFKCGASHYGIGDLTALAADTHKFESRYLHTLLGEGETLASRSPINHIDRFSCPVVFFQGGEDKVVPPNQAEAMVAAVREKGIPVAYVLFPDEAHGFRAADNIVRALESEFSFFSRIFGITPADTLPPINIENLANAPVAGT